MGMICIMLPFIEDCGNLIADEEMHHVLYEQPHDPDREADAGVLDDIHCPVHVVGVDNVLDARGPDQNEPFVIAVVVTPRKKPRKPYPLGADQ